MKSVSLLALLPAAALVSCTPTQQPDVYDQPANANPYGVPGADPYGSAGTNDDYGSTPYQPVQPVNPAPAYNPPAYNPPAVAPVAPGVGTSHVVVSGDSLWGLSRKYNTTVEAIQAANGLTDTVIRTGQTLQIPR